ncbi:transposase [Actinosynnema sp. NPDC023794]
MELSAGTGPLTAAKILSETADIRRFRSRDAYARHNGTAPLPVWSSNRARHRLSRTGNRRLNAAPPRIALTQARRHPDARALLARRRAGGDGGLEALRVLKRHLSDVVYRALHADATITRPTSAWQRSDLPSLHPHPARRRTQCSSPFRRLRDPIWSSWVSLSRAARCPERVDRPRRGLGAW